MDEIEDLKRLGKLVRLMVAAVDSCEGQPVPPCIAPYILAPHGASADDILTVIETCIGNLLVDCPRDDSGRAYFVVNQRGKLLLQKPQGEA